MPILVAQRAESEGVTGDGLADPVVLPVGTPAELLEQRFRYQAAHRGSERTPPDVDGIVDPFRLSNAVHAESFGK